ncbi:MAG: hypothetical protein DWH78_10910 [Planctomycetota bacterium]|nr:MAG: hypothetical protein DWH78_10910 [Planctomycetota bacterium]
MGNLRVRMLEASGRQNIKRCLYLGLFADSCYTKLPAQSLVMPLEPVPWEICRKRQSRPNED